MNSFCVYRFIHIRGPSPEIPKPQTTTTTTPPSPDPPTSVPYRMQLPSSHTRQPKSNPSPTHLEPIHRIFPFHSTKIPTQPPSRVESSSSLISTSSTKEPTPASQPGTQMSKTRRSCESSFFFPAWQGCPLLGFSPPAVRGVEWRVVECCCCCCPHGVTGGGWGGGVQIGSGLGLHPDRPDRLADRETRRSG